MRAYCHCTPLVFKLLIINMANLRYSLSNMCSWIILEALFLLLFRVGNYCSPFFNKDFPNSCDTRNSSIVRKVIQKNWIPLLSKYGVSLPVECPLNLSRDFLGVREDKKRSHKSHWQCNVCGKRFYSEMNLDLHIERKHSELIHKGDDSICLSEFCDIMRCNVIATSSFMEDDLLSTDVSVWAPSPESSLGKPQAETIAFDSHKTWEKAEDVQPEVQDDYFNPIFCNEEYYSSLRQKCADLVWECLRGLISILDADDFKDIQDELESKSCSFLSCSKYTDIYCRSKTRDRIALRPFLIVFGSLLFSLSLALAYYFAWVYTEKYCNSGFCSSI